MTETRIQNVPNIVTEGACPKAVLTFEETARYMGISKSYLYKLTSERSIPHYKPRGKMVYFSLAELEEWLQRNRVLTMDEVREQAHTICRKGGVK